MTGLPCAEADWPRFSALLEAGLDVPVGGQAAWLAALGEEDGRLKPALARVLGQAGARDTAEFLRLPRLDDTGFSPGERIGAYVLVSLLGKGGMGEVWRASRHGDGPRRDVALKLPHPAFLGSAFLRRFARERDVLAALSHPCIAQLYEAGTGDEGHPYLTLELVEGSPITAYCQAASASLGQRIDLVRQVLDALAYAHQRLIVHRDIKPSNVLVTPKGQVKLLDFGIAKLLGGEVEGDAELTQAGRLATPAYAAPEQLSGGAITVATDIFSTGALLFELCTGQRPFARVPESAAAEAAPLASQRADAASAGLPGRPDLARQLRGDLDAIIARALALDPAARYASAEAFEADLRRWRDGLPVVARRIGWVTRGRKFVRRNRLAVALSAVLVMAVAAGTAGVAWQAMRAERQAARATAIKDYLISLFKAADPGASGKRIDELTAHELLRAGAERADRAFAHDPATQIELFETLGDIFDVVRDFSNARGMWARRLDLERTAYGPDDKRVITSAIDLAKTETAEGDFAAARSILADIRSTILRTYGADSPLYADWLTQHASTLRPVPDGRAEATGQLEQAVSIFASSSLSKNDLGYYSNALRLLSFRQVEADRIEEALKTVEKQRVLDMQLEPDNKINDMMYLESLASRLERLGNLRAADALFTAEQTTALRALGPDSHYYINALTGRILLAAKHGDRARANELLETAHASLSSGPGQIRYALAVERNLEGRGAEAVNLLEGILKMSRQAPLDAKDVWRMEAVLGEAYDQAGRTEDARAMLKQCRDDWARYGVPGQPSSLTARERWARFLLDHGEMDKAEPELHAIVDLSRGAAMAPVALAKSELARIALARGDLATARSLSVQSTELLDAIKVEYDVRARIVIWMTQAQVLLAAGQAAEAHGWAAKAASAADMYDAPATRQPVAAHALLALTERPG